MPHQKQPKALEWKDGGYRSRKLWYALFTSGTIFIGAIMSARWPAFSANYEVLVGGLLGSLGLYAGGNVGNKIAVARSQKKALPDESGNPYDDPIHLEDRPRD